MTCDRRTIILNLLRLYLKALHCNLNHSMHRVSCNITVNLILSPCQNAHTVLFAHFFVNPHRIQKHIAVSINHIDYTD